MKSRDIYILRDLIPKIVLKLISGINIKKYDYIFLFDDSVARGKIENNKFKIICHKLNIYILNLLELIISIYKKRKPNYLNIVHISGFFGNQVFYNFINGTIVSLNDENVYKIYLKESKHYYKLYTTLFRPSNIIDVQNLQVDDSEVTLLIMSKLNILREYLNNDKIIINLNKVLNNFYLLNKNNTIDGCTLILYIDRLARLIGSVPNLILSNYVDIAIMIEKTSNQNDYVLCHGDLWHGNILLNSSDEVELIDFDKSFYFNKYYDLVYYLLMEELSKGYKIINLLDTEEIKKQSKCIFNTLVRFKLSIPITDIILCVFCFCFIKSAEEDFYYSRTKNYKKLKSTFDSLFR